MLVILVPLLIQLVWLIKMWQINGTYRHVTWTDVCWSAGEIGSLIGLKLAFCFPLLLIANGVFSRARHPEHIRSSAILQLHHLVLW